MLFVSCEVCVAAWCSLVSLPSKAIFDPYYTMSAKASASGSAAVGEKRRLDDRGAPRAKDKSKRNRPLVSAAADASSSGAGSGAAATSGSSSGSTVGPVTFDLSGCSVACVRLPSGSGAGWADIMVKPDPDHDRRVHVFSFGRSLSTDDLKAALGRGAGGVSVSSRSEGAADPSNGLSMHAAVLEFRDADAAARALDVASSFPSTDGDGSSLGLKGMLGALGSHRQDPRELQLAVDIFMNAFEAAEEKVRSRACAIRRSATVHRPVAEQASLPQCCAHSQSPSDMLDYIPCRLRKPRLQSPRQWTQTASQS